MYDPQNILSGCPRHILDIWQIISLFKDEVNDEERQEKEVQAKPNSCKNLKEEEKKEKKGDPPR